jgi:hypothetical protein
MVKPYVILTPDIQLSFLTQLNALSELYLSQALTNTILTLDIQLIDNELNTMVNKKTSTSGCRMEFKGRTYFSCTFNYKKKPISFRILSTSLWFFTKNILSIRIIWKIQIS